MVKKVRLLHTVTLYNTYTRYTHAHYQEFIAVKFLRGLVVIAISQLLDLHVRMQKKFASYDMCMLERSCNDVTQPPCSYCEYIIIFIHVPVCIVGACIPNNTHIIYVSLMHITTVIHTPLSLDSWLQFLGCTSNNLWFL